MNSDIPAKPKFPSDGTLIEEPSSNPNFIIHALIGSILDISPQGIHEKSDWNLMLSAARMEREFTVGTRISIELNDRREDVVFMIDSLIALYNRLAETVPFSTHIILVDGHPMGRKLWFTREERRK